MPATHAKYVDNAHKTSCDSENTLNIKLDRAKIDLKNADSALSIQNQTLSLKTDAAARSKKTSQTSDEEAKKSKILERFVELSGGTLANKGPDMLSTLVQPLLDANPPGGVIFIDEAHQLISSSSPRGKDVIQLLVKYAEDHRSVLSFVLAGYAKDMELLIEADPGLASRFPIQNMFVFEDYSANQLTDILLGMVKTIPVPSGKPMWKFENDNIAGVIGRRIARGRGKKGFSNARAVRIYLEGAIMSRNADRISNLLRNSSNDSSLDEEALFTITSSDAFGQEPDPSSSKPFKELNSMIGLQNVKESFKDLMRVLKSVWDADMTGESCTYPQLNRIFTGPPGTGKLVTHDLGFSLYFH